LPSSSGPSISVKKRIAITINKLIKNVGDDELTCVFEIIVLEIITG
jgi:hypothetical protein